MEYETIRIEKQGRAGLVRINRPKVYNALNVRALQELMDALETFDRDGDVGAMVIYGDERAFAAGADIPEMAQHDTLSIMTSGFIPIFHRMRNVRKPVIAAVCGYCLGGGNEIALACDMIIASPTAKFGQPEITLGIMPGAGGTQRLTHSIGRALAMEMVLNNRHLSAEEALAHGLINRIVDNERVLSEALKMANEIAERAPLAVLLAKQAVNDALELPLSVGMESEKRSFHFLFASQDQKEGMRAYMEKRPPHWTGA